MRRRLLERLSAAGTSAASCAGHSAGRSMVALLPAPAYAHKLNVFASAEGKTIQGKVYFSGGTPAQDVAVTALSPTGQQIGETKTDEEGRFALEARFRCDYRLLADTGDGHGGEYTFTASVCPKIFRLCRPDGERKRGKRTAEHSPGRTCRPESASVPPIASLGRPV